nr:uncharacterized protein LOC113814992 [Penaeus vannamei]
MRNLSPKRLLPSLISFLSRRRPLPASHHAVGGGAVSLGAPGGPPAGGLRLRPHGGLSGRPRGRRQQHGARRLPQGRPRRAADGRDALHHALPVRPDAPRGRRVPARPPRHAGQGRPLQPRRRPLRRDAGRGRLQRQSVRGGRRHGQHDPELQPRGPPRPRLRGLGRRPRVPGPPGLPQVPGAHGVRPDQDRPSRQAPRRQLLQHVPRGGRRAPRARRRLRLPRLRLRAAAPRGARLLRPVPGPSPAWNLAYVGDSDDLQYLFSFDKLNVSLTKEEDLFVSRIMVDLWTNFAATGNPTPDLSLGFKWTPTEASSLSYLGITSAPAMKVYDREQDIEFWRNLPRKMNKLLYPDRFSQNSN